MWTISHVCYILKCICNHTSVGFFNCQVLRINYFSSWEYVKEGINILLVIFQLRKVLFFMINLLLWTISHGCYILKCICNYTSYVYILLWLSILITEILILQYSNILKMIFYLVQKKKVFTVTCWEKNWVILSDGFFLIIFFILLFVYHYLCNFWIYW